MRVKAVQTGMGKSSPHDDKLVFLEIGRALAALIVVFHHADQATAYFSDVARGRFFIWGQYGVDFFFVLSGFIIFHAHRTDATGIFPTRLYVFKRLSRIYIPYLPIALAYMGLLLVFQQQPLSERSWSIWATITLLPMEKSSALSVAWTLTYELMFYAFFLLSFLSRQLLLAASAIWSGYLLAVLFGLVDVPDHAVMFAFSNPIILEFFCGAIAAHFLLKVPPQMRLPILASGIALLLAVIATWTGERAFLGPPLALIVLGAAMTRYTVPRSLIKFLIFLGAASYAIYLVHSPVVSIMAEVLQPLGMRWPTFLACVLSGTAFGVLYHVCFERSAMRWARRFKPGRVR